MIRVLSVGVFDLFHVGHLRYLQYAREQGDHLSVAVTADAICAAVKNKMPVIPEAERLEIVRGLRCVDHAALLPASLEDTDASARWIPAWRADLVVIGDGWEGSPRWQRLGPRLAENGIEVRFAPETPDISSTQLAKRLLASGR